MIHNLWSINTRKADCEMDMKALRVDVVGNGYYVQFVKRNTLSGVVHKMGGGYLTGRWA